MASSRDYLEYVLDQLSGLEAITVRAMMGEYILYYKGKFVGGIYDDRLLVKPTKTALRLIPEGRMELPYEGGKAMLLVDNVDSSAFLSQLIPAIYEELPKGKGKQ